MQTSPTKEFEIHENQRYWMATGWGGLLPNDRGKYSYPDGSKSWKRLEDTPLPLGFDFVEGSQWKYSDTYYYARDFTVSAIQKAKPDHRGALHWVRYRSLSRTLQLQPIVIGGESHQCCDYADSKKVFGLADFLLDAVTYCCILSDFKQHSIEKYKRELLQLACTHLVDQPDAFFNFEVLLRDLGEAVEQKRQSMNRIFSDTPPSFVHRKQIPDFAQQTEIVDPLFTERTTIALLLVKRLDPQFQLHCEKENCGGDCHFAWLPCPNDGCTAVASKLYQEAHDEQCRFKIVACNCGDSFPRHKEQQYKTSVCSLREASCPFAKLGCTTIAQAKYIGEHVSNETSSHLLLAFDRMMEYESTMRKLHQRVQALEEENIELKKLIALSRESTNSTLGGTDRALSNTQKKLNSVENVHRKEVKRLHDDVKKLRNELVRLKAGKP